MDGPIRLTASLDLFDDGKFAPKLEPGFRITPPTNALGWLAILLLVVAAKEASANGQSGS